MLNNEVRSEGGSEPPQKSARQKTRPPNVEGLLGGRLSEPPKIGASGDAPAEMLKVRSEGGSLSRQKSARQEMRPPRC
ncbi:hypothetical protein HRbin17_01101 [bacterium HR17]|uniref:Uncharacterized protein n=1 Tax=Candidatus Fervidibacter japonicus TaxID=2035412 RepID=A0A2H5XBV1_9BACT|nr:hypothetical protein HRbin17_01101 [bacterium HR17]